MDKSVSVLGCVQTHDSDAQPDPQWVDERSDRERRADALENDATRDREHTSGERELPEVALDRRLG